MDLLILLLVLLMLPVFQPVSGKLRRKCRMNLEHRDGKNPPSYYRPGDHLVSVVTTATLSSNIILPFNMAPSSQSISWAPSGKLSADKFRIVRFIFAIHVANKNPQLLHNLTLGYNIHDNSLSTRVTSDALLDMLSTGEANVPNYSCGKKDSLLTLLDAARRDISIQMSTLVGTYKVPQISYLTASEALSDKTQFPFYHRMLPNGEFQDPAIVHLLLHFRWTLIGLFASDTEKGENFMRILTPMLVRNGICVVISQRFSMTRPPALLRKVLSKWRQVNVFVHFLEYVSISDRILPFHETLQGFPGPIEGKVWITTNLGTYSLRKDRRFKHVHSIWSFSFQRKQWPKDDGFEPYLFVDVQYEDQYFRCSFSNRVSSANGRRRCTQKASMETQQGRNTLRISNNKHVYSIVKSLVHVLNAAYSSRYRRRRKEGKESLGTPRLQPWQVRDPAKYLLSIN
ncbi:vomeronasal type-2 receptor 26-like [Ahaetulla prasina]|uniref:vomeronasal type-2 receptor 26-like n=1 Tax=Ahaetulla prasina TaxID=499056 RepID=UPI0026478DA3|nr:vomeronasal type-2 receptor 26-like [Ahaetulla prasina]